MIYLLFLQIINTKDIKKLTNISLNTVAVILFIAALLPIVLQNSKIQNTLSDIIESQLSKQLGTTISIETVHYKLFNRLSVKKLYVEDLHKDTLLSIENTYLDFDLFQIIKGNILFTSAIFNQLEANIVKYNNGTTNIDFIIEAFKQPKKDSISNISYQIRRFKIKDSRISYRVESDTIKKYVSRFKPNDILITNLNTDIGLNMLKKDSIDLTIKDLCFKEKSGFELKHFSTKILANQKETKITHIVLGLPNSNIYFSEIKLRYGSLEAIKKNIYENLRFVIPLSTSEIYLSDFSAFVPAFEQMNKRIELSTTISGNIANLVVAGFNLNHERKLFLKTDFEVNGLPDFDNLFIYSNINELTVDRPEIQDIISRITRKPFILPKELNNLGVVNYKGNITGFMNNLVAFGKLKTDIGSISTDILVKFDNAFKDIEYNGKLSTNHLNLSHLLNSKNVGSITMDISTKGKKTTKSPLKGNINGTIHSFDLMDYNYKDIKLDGKYDGSGFDGEININDPNIVADFKGVIDARRKLPVYNFDLDVYNANLYALHLVKKIKDFSVSFQANTNITGKNADNINGNLSLKNISISTYRKAINIDELTVISRIDNNHTNINIHSDYINGSISGLFTYSKLPAFANNILQEYIPSLSKTNKTVVANNNNINIDLSIANISNLTDLLELPFDMQGTSTIKGNLSSVDKSIDIKANVPAFRYSTMNFENIELGLNNKNKRLNLFTTANMLQKKNAKTAVNLTASAANDTMFTKLGWLGATAKHDASVISTATYFSKHKGNLAAKLIFHPSQIYISDSLWNVNNSVIDFNADSTLTIKDFHIERNNQYLHINGFLSKKSGDDLHVDMKELDLGFIMSDILKLKAIAIDGKVSGLANVTSKSARPVLEADLVVNDAKLNNKGIGDAYIKSTWDKTNSQIVFDAEFLNTGTDTTLYADGIYKPSNDSIDIVFDLHGTSIGFLQRYFDGVVDNVKGEGYGKLRMFGPTKDIGFKGDIFVQNASVKVNVLNTTYSFSDTIRLTPKTIEIDNVQFYDAERNRGTINGLVRHNGGFSKMKYDVNIKGTNIIGMDTHAKDNATFYGKAYATGTVRISGNDDECEIMVNAETQPKSRGFINMGSASTASDNSFITFESAIDTVKTVKKIDKNRFNTKVDLNIDVTSDAEMQLIVDPKAGDNITGRGNGSLRMNFDTFSDIKLYGAYTIDYGYYIFTLQSIVRKDFKIDEGSTITWTGNPFAAKVNIRAIYPLTASLSNILDEAEISNSTRRASVPVNCVLKLTDDLMSPDIKFDIDLPTADESLKQKVRNVVNTDEMMNQQIAYLLAFNSFYNLQQVENASASTFNSFLTSTLSAHLNNFLHKSLNTDIISLGVDMQKTDQSDTQYKANVVIQPNERIILNSNVGYRDDNYTQNPEDKYMLDFDFEYLLTKNGKIRFKAYSHTIDRAQLKDAKTTQGLGFVYKEDFQSVSEMLRYYWRKITFQKTNVTATDSVKQKNNKR